VKKGNHNQILTLSLVDFSVVSILLPAGGAVAMFHLLI